MKFRFEVAVTTTAEVWIEADSLEAAEELAKGRAVEETADIDAEHFTADIVNMTRECQYCGDDHNVLEEGTYEGLCVDCAEEAHKEDEADRRRDDY